MTEPEAGPAHEYLRLRGWGRQRGLTCPWLYYKRFSSKDRCRTNYDKEGVQIIVEEHYLPNFVTEWSYTLSLRADPGRHWVDLRIYGLTTSDLYEGLDTMCRQLINLWEVLPKKPLEE